MILAYLLELGALRFVLLLLILSLSATSAPEPNERQRAAVHLALNLIGRLGLNGEEAIESTLLLRAHSQSQLVGTFAHALFAVLQGISTNLYREVESALEALLSNEERNETFDIRLIPLELRMATQETSIARQDKARNAHRRPSKASPQAS